MKDCMRVVEDGFRQLAAGKVAMPQRPTIRVPEYKATINVMPAYIGGMDALGLKMVSGYLDNPSRFGLPTVQATILLNDAKTGKAIAVMDGTFITAMRTGAASGVATKYLARSDSSTVGLIGAGAQSRTQLMAVCEARKISAAKVFSPREESRKKFAKEMDESLGMEVEPVVSAKDAVEGADVICTASTSKTPVVSSDWVDEGVHINGIGSHSPDARELDSETVARAKLVVDTREAALKEAGDILIPISEGRIGEGHIYAELGDLVAGRKPGRQNPKEVTIFKSQGLAVEDVSTALEVYRLAESRGVGKNVAM
jgi:ornithine cyclodeaminase/alanine dehydrogenase